VPTTTSTSHLRFGILCVLAYVALSWAVRFDMRLGTQIASLVYPLDTFSMYAGMPGEDASHLLVRDAAGEVHRVTAFRSYACVDSFTRDAALCAKQRGVIPYHYDDLTDYIRSHVGVGDVDVELIVRTWKLRPGFAPEWSDDCRVTRCKVSR
jgi:hypothetical protein